MKESIQNIERIAKAIQVFSKPTRISIAAKKLNFTERNVYRIIESLEEDGFVFKKLAKGYKIESVPESAVEEVEYLAGLLQSMSIK